MKSHEILRLACEAKGAKFIASEMGVSQALLYKWMQPDDELGSGTRNPLDRMSLLIQLTGDRRLLDWLCRQAHGFFIENPEETPPPEGFHPAMSTLLQEFADMLSNLAQAGEDQEITLVEAEEMRLQWDKMKSVCEGFVGACERGDYANVRQLMHAAREQFPQLVKSA